MLPSRFTSWLTINRLCNLRCDWCYAKMLNFSARENMSFEVVKKSVSFLKGLPLQDVILIGGEPTLHPDFLGIISLINGSGLRPSVITNSVAFKDKELLNEAIRAGIIGVTTSLKAASDIQYEKFTGKKAFSDVMSAIENINGTGIFHKLSITVHRGLFDNFDEMIKVIVQSRINLVSLDMERPIIINNRACSPEFSSPKEMADFFLRVYPKLESCGTQFVLKISIPFCLFPASFIQKLVDNDQIISGCQIFGGSGIIIDPKGRILPCNHFCDNPLGQLGKDFNDAQEYLLFRQRPDIVDFYSKMASCPDQECVSCRQWKFCGAGCRMHWLYRDADELLGQYLKKGGGTDVGAGIISSAVQGQVA